MAAIGERSGLVRGICAGKARGKSKLYSLMKTSLFVGSFFDSSHIPKMGKVMKYHTMQENRLLSRHLAHCGMTALWY